MFERLGRFLASNDAGTTPQESFFLEFDDSSGVVCRLTKERTFALYPTIEFPQ